MAQLRFELPNALAAKLRDLTGNKRGLTDQVVEFSLVKYFEQLIGEHPQRRRLERAPVNMSVVYSIVGDGRSQNVSAIDLSGSGVRISSVERLGPGTQIELQSRLPKTKRVILCRGQVIMSFFDDKTNQYSHGVAFTYVSQSDQEAIVAFVQDTLGALDKGNALMAS